MGTFSDDRYAKKYPITPGHRVVLSRRLASQKGIALVMALIMSLAIMAMAGGVLFFVTQSTLLSGAGKRYSTASEAADGGVNFMKDMINKTMRGDVQPSDSATWDMVDATPACLTDAILSNTTWNVGNLCRPTITFGNFTANVTLTQLYKIGIGTVEFASSTGTGGVATFYKITVAVTGPDNASAEDSVLYRYIN
jgi:hypothetical protein